MSYELSNNEIYNNQQYDNQKNYYKYSKYKNKYLKLKKDLTLSGSGGSGDPELDNALSNLKKIMERINSDMNNKADSEMRSKYKLGFFKQATKEMLDEFKVNDIYYSDDEIEIQRSRSLSIDSSSSDSSSSDGERSRSSSIDSSLSEPDNDSLLNSIADCITNVPDNTKIIVDVIKSGKRHSTEIKNLANNIYTHPKFQQGLELLKKSGSQVISIKYSDNCKAKFIFSYELNSTTLSLNTNELKQRKQYIVNDLNDLFGLNSVSPNPITIKNAKNVIITSFPLPKSGNNTYAILYNINDDEQIKLINKIKSTIDNVSKMKKMGIIASRRGITVRDNKTQETIELDMEKTCNTNCVIEKLTISGNRAIIAHNDGGPTDPTIESILQDIKQDILSLEFDLPDYTTVCDRTRACKKK
jgi:hypothetical protein